MSFARPDPTMSVLLLSAISAVVLDSETTGLDVKSDRILQIGGVGIKAGVIQHADVIDSFVNSGVAIPASSTKIHGIDDAMVKAAPTFTEAMKELSGWAGSVDSTFKPAATGAPMGPRSCPYRR